MNRKTLIQIHLIAAAFFTPALVIIAISGGLYLLGIKGSVSYTEIPVPANVTFNAQANDLEAEMQTLLSQLNIEHTFEYVKVSGNTFITRPTTRTFYEIKAKEGALTVAKASPSVQKRLIELHKGHGPLLFKDFQKFMAAALLLILLTGTWLGLSATGLRTTTSISISAGLVIFVVLGFLL